MRIGGWILLVLGIALLALFAMAQAGGGNMPATAYIVAGILVLTGWRMKSAAGGLAPKARAASAPPGPAVPATATIARGGAATAAPAAAAGPTVELPLTPDVAAVIGAARARSGRVTVIVVVAGAVFFVALGAIIDSAMASSSPGSFKVLPSMAIMALLFAAIVGGIWLLQKGLPVSRDLRSPTYLRTAGPVQLLSLWGGYMLRLADRSFVMKGRAGARPLIGVPWATVDYTAHGHVILGAWDRSGKQVYAAPGYAAAPPQVPPAGGR